MRWTIDPNDWKERSTDEIVAHVSAKLSPGAIVLLHDGGGSDRGPTAAAVAGIVAAAHGARLAMVDVAAELAQ